MVALVTLGVAVVKTYIYIYLDGYMFQLDLAFVISKGNKFRMNMYNS